jgi:5'-nucleotidase
VPHTPRRTTRAASLAAAAAVGLGGLLVFAAPAQAADPTTIQLLGINDFHGRIQENTGNTPPIPGAAKLVGLVNDLRDDMPTAFVSSGDNIGASTYASAIQGDEPTLDVLNAGGLNVSAVGNHEFDRGYDDLVNRVAPSSQFPYLGANVYRGGERALEAYSVQDVGGVRVGYIGVVTVQTPSLVSPDGIAGLEFTDPVTEANLVAAQLKDGDDANGEADVVVLLAHEGAGETSVPGACLGVYEDEVFGAFARSSAAIDAILSAHTHQAYAYQMPVPGMAKTRPVVQAASYSTALSRVTLTFDGNTVTASTAELLDPLNAVPDATVAGIVDQAVADSIVLGAEPVGSITADFPNGSNNRDQQWAINNLVPTAQLASTAPAGRGGAQLAFVNPGGVRAGLTYAPSGGEGPGVVTYGEAFAVQPFANDVVTVSLTGAQIKQALSQQVQPLDASRPFLQLGVSDNVTYSYRYTPTAEGVLGTLIVDSMTVDGVEVIDTESYRVTINTFLAAGGDNFSAFALGTDKVTTGDNDLAMLREYLLANPNLDPADFGPFATLTGEAPSSGPVEVPEPQAPLTPAECPAAVATAAVTLSATTARGGDTIHVVGTDFAPYETVSAALYSEPLAVGTAAADENGVVTFDVVLGELIEAGDHSVRLIGLGSDIDVSAGFVVEALAATGGNEREQLVIGLTLVLAGAGALYLGRRRPSSAA